LFFCSQAFGSNANDTDCDPLRGQKIFGKCATCHTLDASAIHGVGPNLHAIVGGPIGKQHAYKYSKALREAQGHWSPDKLHAYLLSPMVSFPGTTMGFAGLKRQQDRDDVICFLAQDK